MRFRKNDNNPIQSQQRILIFPYLRGCLYEKRDGIKSRTGQLLPRIWRFFQPGRDN